MEGSPCDQEEAAKDPAAKQRPLGEWFPLYPDIIPQPSLSSAAGVFYKLPISWVDILLWSERWIIKR